MIHIIKHLRGKRIVRRIQKQAAESCRTLKNKSVAPLCLTLSATISLSVLYSGASLGHEFIVEQNRDGYLSRDAFAAQEDPVEVDIEDAKLVVAHAVKSNKMLPGESEGEKKQLEEEMRRQAELERQRQYEARMQAQARARQAQQQVQQVHVASAPANPNGNVRLGQELAARRGYIGEQWSCLYNLWSRESGWNNYAANPVSSAYGIAQFLNSTWANYGYQRTSDPYTQIQAGLDYIERRYSTPCGAWGFFLNNRWY